MPTADYYDFCYSSDFNDGLEFINSQILVNYVRENLLKN